MKVVACDEESFDLKQDQKEKTPSKPVVITIANTSKNLETIRCRKNPGR